MSAGDARRVLCWGLGPVGVATAAWLVARGYAVTGVDTDAGRVAALADGQSPVDEPGLDEAVSAAVRSGQLSAVAVEQAVDLVCECEASLLCVGTPGLPGGALDVSALVAAARSIGAGVRRAGPYHLVAVRSTVMPGTTRSLAAALAEAAGSPSGERFGLAAWPEFLREGSALADVMAPSLSVVGALDDRSANLARDLAGPEARVVGLEDAETLKLAANAFHALKITFANETARIAEAAGGDGALVLELLRSDTRLNASGAYLRPGFAFGGPCLEKDVVALAKTAASSHIAAPLLGGVLDANGATLDAAVARIRATGARRVALAGVGFKPGVPDVRGSPTLALAGRLLAAGLDVCLHDPHVTPDALAAAAPGLSAALVSADKALECGLLVLLHPAARFEPLVAGAAASGLRVLDFSGGV